MSEPRRGPASMLRIDSDWIAFGCRNPRLMTASSTSGRARRRQKPGLEAAPDSVPTPTAFRLVVELGSGPTAMFFGYELVQQTNSPANQQSRATTVSGNDSLGEQTGLSNNSLVATTVAATTSLGERQSQQRSLSNDSPQQRQSSKQQSRKRAKSRPTQSQQRQSQQQPVSATAVSATQLPQRQSSTTVSATSPERQSQPTAVSANNSLANQHPQATTGLGNNSPSNDSLGNDSTSNGSLSNKRVGNKLFQQQPSAATFQQQPLEAANGSEQANRFSRNKRRQR